MRLAYAILAAAVVGACAGSRSSATQATGIPMVPLCGSQTSGRDTDGALVGSTGDTTTIRVGAPQEIRADLETTFHYRMTGNAPIHVNAEATNGAVGAWGRITRIDPSANEPTSTDGWALRR